MRRETVRKGSEEILQRSTTGHPKAVFALHIPAKSTLLALLVPLFGQFQSSTLAIWPHNTPHRLGALQSHLRLFADRSPALTRKKSPCKEFASCWKVHSEKRGKGATSPIQHDR